MKVLSNTLAKTGMTIELDIEVGDILLSGKYKNKRVVVKTIGTDDLGQPTINGKPLLNARIEKHLPPEKQSKKTREGLSEARKLFKGTTTPNRHNLSQNPYMKISLKRCHTELFKESSEEYVKKKDANTATVMTTSGDEKTLLMDEGYLDEADYPQGWNMEEFKNLPSTAAKVRYAQQHLGKKLGAGSARIVFKIDDNTVMKLAKNKKGIAQNEVEADVSRIGYSIIADVLDEEPNGLYIEMERAKKMKAADFKAATGYSFNDFKAALHYQSLRRRPSRWGMPSKPAGYEAVDDSEFFHEVVGLMADFDMPAGDLMRPSSWGIVERGGTKVPVLVDYGFTQSVDDEFYS